MSRKTIAKYFAKLQELNLIEENENDPLYYYLTLLDVEEASLIEYTTL